MDNFILQYSYRNRCIVIIDGDVYVYKHEEYKFDKPFLSLKPEHIFIVESTVCEMTDFSGAAINNSNFDGNTLLLQCENNEHIYISGSEIFKFKTDDKIKDYISLMGNNMVPYAVIVGEQYTYFFDNRYTVIEKDKIEEGNLINATNNSLDPYDYHVKKCGKDAFRKLEHTQVHTCWPGFEEGEENEDDDLVEEDEENEDLIESI